MNYPIVIVMVLIVVSKYFDCYSTYKLMHHYGCEKNPLASKIMKRFGIGFTVWAGFVLTIVIVLATGIPALNSEESGYKIGFIILGLIIGITQTLVVSSNYSRNLNIFTRQLSRIYIRFK